MPLKIVRNDITKMKVDAIVNAANSSLLGGGGVDGCIHRAAGPNLLKECAALGGCATGDAKLTKGYNLPAKYVIHAVGPVWRGGRRGEKEQLASCYRKALNLAKEQACESIAFPLISSGIYGYPKDEALQVAVEEIRTFLSENEMEVFIVIFDRNAFQISGKIFSDITSYIDDHYVEEQERRYPKTSRIISERPESAGYPQPQAAAAGQTAGLGAAVSSEQTSSMDQAASAEQAEGLGAAAPSIPPEEAETAAPVEETVLFASTAPKQAVTKHVAPSAAAKTMSLDEALGMIDESFSEMLLRKIDEEGMTDAQCYKKANIDRKLFSKIRSNPQYKPSKPTAIAFAIALELSLDETKELLLKAGYALTHSSKFDIIIEYFILKENYDIYEINEALFAFDQNLLGA